MHLRDSTLTADDKKHGIQLALKVWPDRSQRGIADQVGCSQRYVGKVRAQVRTTSHLPERTIATDGKSYPARRRAPQAEAGIDDEGRGDRLRTIVYRVLRRLNYNEVPLGEDEAEQVSLT